jgi:dsDNA-specific endonuclease/ATPase MutS2
MREFKPGENVKVVHETVQGKVIEVSKDQVIILDDDGFKRTYKASELVHATPTDKYDATVNATPIAKTESLTSKKRAKTKSSVKDIEPEIDLHIEELIDDHRGLTNSEILAIQMRHCRGFVEKAISRRTRRIVIVHGKGEGVLRTAVYDYLDKLRFEQDINLRYDDGADSIYGIGGSTVVIFGSW